MATRETGRESPHRLRRQRDLGHQHDRLLPAVDHLADAVQIDFGLAAAGDAQQQVDREPASAITRGSQHLHRMLLICIDAIRLRAVGRIRNGIGEARQVRFGRDRNQAQPRELANGGGGCAGVTGESHQLDSLTGVQQQQSGEDCPALGSAGFLQDRSWISSRSFASRTICVYPMPIRFRTAEGRTLSITVPSGVT